ncbi:metal ABC transporter ATP-binding protein [Actinocrispum wychmicini]|uniref:Zinc/manganese transport system ATP-binding protein n=1 Tax=Actinocrispum wychmicini TaxID=1213861 RepID=A0A4V6NNW5_9PSEU|nr:metal ABC transporter ATP-binding protein [Actinocrispum wychmicini]TCO58020.1 zinc/manganese transport system ATP-binding protein [Actinocrispum wychmicini]
MTGDLLSESSVGAVEQPLVSLRGATLSYGQRALWADLDLDLCPGEFVAVLGPNGSGKTSLLRVLLGLQKLSSGRLTLPGGDHKVGYIPQQRAVDPSITLRGRDLVALGYDGHKWGVGLKGMRTRRQRVDEAIRAVGATAFANRPVGLLSGGEQQRLRVAQALVSDPAVLLCDEPLLSLDLAHQRAVSELIDKRRTEADTAVLFVTHEINPILPLVDRVLYLVDGRFRIGAPDEVMTSEVLSELYRTQIDVVRVRDQIIVVGAHGAVESDQPHHLQARSD